MPRLYFLIISVFMMFSPACFAAEEDDDVVIFARYEPAQESVIEGDSIQVNVVLYSNCAFLSAECTTKNIKIKGGNSRLVQRRGNRQQQRVRLADGIYYAILWDTYVVGSNKPGEIKFPQLQFEGEVEVLEPEVYVDPLDPFGFFSAPRHKSHKAKARCKCPAFELPVTTRPKRSTREVISSGGKVA